MKLRTLTAFILLCTLACFHANFATCSAATHTWTGASGDGKWSTAFNWSGSSAPVANEAASVVLVFPPAGSKRSTNDLANLTVDQIQITGDNYFIAATGAGADVTLRSQVFGSTFFITGANAVLTNFTFTLATDIVTDGSLAVGTGNTATFRSHFTGPGNLVKRGAGTIVLRGSSANTYTGQTRVDGGLLQLNQTGNAIPGELLIGNPALTGAAEVELLFQNQIADSASILVNSNGTFFPSVFTETIGSITLSNVNFVAGIGLTLNGPFTSVGTNTVTGTIRLGGANRVFNITGHLNLDAFLENPAGTAGPIKNGAGVLELKRANTFNGQLTINDGIVRATHATALGTTGAGTLVNAGGALELAPGLTIVNEPLTLAGHGFNTNGNLILHHGSTWNGDIMLNPLVDDCRINVPDAAEVAVINGIISGAYLGKIGAGTLRLGGNSANTSEGTWVRRGILELAKPAGVNAVTGELEIGDDLDQPNAATVRLLAANQIHDNIWVSIRPSGRLHLNGFSERYGATYLLRGNLTTGAGTLHLGGDIFVTPAGQNYSDERAFIVGNLTLNHPERGIEVLANQAGVARLEINGQIADGVGASGLKVTGGGSVDLIGGTHTYSGITRVTGSSKLYLSYGATPGSSSGGTLVEGGSSLLLSDVIAGAEALTLHEDPTDLQVPLRFMGNNDWNGPVQLNGNCMIYGFQGDLLTLAGAVNGPGALVKRGGGILRLAGSDDNQLAGGIRVDHGQLELQKTSGAVAIPGPLTIGEAQIQGSVIVRLLAPNQIGNNVVPFIESNGTLDLNGFNDAIGGLYLRGGAVATGLGTLTLLGDVQTDNSPLNGFFSPAAIYGNLSLGGASRTFNVGSNGIPHTLSIAAHISDGGAPAGIKVTGPTNYGGSWTILQTSSSFSGPAIVSQGTLHVWNSGALGSPAGGTIVSNGAAIALGLNLHVTAEPLTLSGSGPLSDGSFQVEGKTTNLWSGPIILNGAPALVRVSDPDVAGFSDHVALVLDGPISGTGDLTISALGRVTLAGNQANSYSGLTMILSGDVRLAKTNTIAISGDLTIEPAPVSRVTLGGNEQVVDNATVEINGTGELRLNEFAQTVISLAGTGTLDAGTGQLIINSSGPDSLFGGIIIGSGGTNLVHIGSSTLELTNHSPFSGKTVVQGGSLFVTGSISNSAVNVLGGARLGGIGTVGSLTSSGGIIATGANGAAPQYGRLRSLGSVNLGSASEFHVDLGGTNAGVDCDQLEMLGGALVIPGCSLVVEQHANGAISNQYPILNVVSGGASMGAFSGIADGVNVISTSGQMFRVNYFAGIGNNDIVLTQLQAPASAGFTGISAVPAGMQLQGSGAPNTSYLIQANTDLSTTNWVNLGAAQADGTGAIVFVDEYSSQYPMRFYRFKQQ